jgi:hypothetical protein
VSCCILKKEKSSKTFLGNAFVAVFCKLAALLKANILFLEIVHIGCQNIENFYADYKIGNLIGEKSLPKI